MTNRKTFIQFADFKRGFTIRVPHLHVCSQTRGDADWTKTHTVLPDAVRVNLRESETEREIGHIGELHKSNF